MKKCWKVGENLVIIFENELKLPEIWKKKLYKKSRKLNQNKKIIENHLKWSKLLMKIGKKCKKFVTNHEKML